MRGEAAAHADPAGLEGGDQRLHVLAHVEHQEVRLGGNGAPAVPRELGREPAPRAVEPLALAGHEALLGEAGPGGGEDGDVHVLHGGVGPERLRVRGGGDGVAEPHAGHPVDLREGPSHDDVGEALDVLQRRSGRPGPRRSGGTPRRRRPRRWAGPAARKARSSSPVTIVPVGLFGLQTYTRPGPRVAGAGHGRQVVAEVGGERHLDRLGLRDLRVVEDGLEGRLGRHDRPARARERPRRTGGGSRSEPQPRTTRSGVTPWRRAIASVVSCSAASG